MSRICSHAARVAPLASLNVLRSGRSLTADSSSALAAPPAKLNAPWCTVRGSECLQREIPPLFGMLEVLGTLSFAGSGNISSGAREVAEAAVLSLPRAAKGTTAICPASHVAGNRGVPLLDCAFVRGVRERPTSGGVEFPLPSFFFKFPLPSCF